MVLPKMKKRKKTPLHKHKKSQSRDMLLKIRKLMT
jgi:hypothetical protein